jgi:proteasome lid subunit RPN8/RPN11
LFSIKPIDFLQAKLNNNLVAVFHTHVEGSEKFSEYDKENSENCLCPFLVYSLETKKFSLFDKSYFERSEKCVNKLRGILDD